MIHLEGSVSREGDHRQKIGWSPVLLKQLLHQQLIILTLAGSPKIKCSI